MGKNKLKEVFRGTAACFLLLGLVSLGGCETAKGFGTGTALAVEGAGNDVNGFFESIKSADEWFKENLW